MAITELDHGWEGDATILLVDDARVNRALLSINLGQHGYRTLEAVNGWQALEVLKAHPEVDLIILDLIMPEMDGFSFLNKRNDHPELKNIPVIVNSSLDDFGSIATALESGAYDYFIKPISTDDLKLVLPLKIKNAITTRRLLMETKHQNDLMLRELRLAARYQHFLLPKQAGLPGAEVTYLFRPCSGVGGDYFDFVDLGNGRAALMVADVSGHGVASAMIASIVKALLPGYLQGDGTPGSALKRLNEDLLRLTPEDVFVTAFVAVFNQPESRLTWSSAGHPPPLLFSPEKSAEFLENPSPFLGVFEADSGLLNYGDNVLQIESGDRLALYTDGLTEAPDPEGVMFGPDRMVKLLNENRRTESGALRQIMLDELSAHVLADFPDDVAFILVDF